MSPNDTDTSSNENVGMAGSAGGIASLLEGVRCHRTMECYRGWWGWPRPWPNWVNLVGVCRLTVPGSGFEYRGGYREKHRRIRTFLSRRMRWRLCESGTAGFDLQLRARPVGGSPGYGVCRT